MDGVEDGESLICRPTTVGLNGGDEPTGAYSVCLYIKYIFSDDSVRLRKARLGADLKMAWNHTVGRQCCGSI